MVDAQQAFVKLIPLRVLKGKVLRLFCPACSMTTQLNFITIFSIYCCSHKHYFRFSFWRTRVMYSQICHRCAIKGPQWLSYIVFCKANVHIKMYICAKMWIAVQFLTILWLKRSQKAGGFRSGAAFDAWAPALLFSTTATGKNYYFKKWKLLHCCPSNGCTLKKARGNFKLHIHFVNIQINIYD